MVAVERDLVRSCDSPLRGHISQFDVQATVSPANMRATLMVAACLGGMLLPLMACVERRQHPGDRREHDQDLTPHGLIPLKMEPLTHGMGPSRPRGRAGRRFALQPGWDWRAATNSRRSPRYEPPPLVVSIDESPRETSRSTTRTLNPAA